MDAILLARIQFGFAAGFHFLFPPTTLGLTLLIVILETLYLKSKNEIYQNLSSFLIKILGLVFVLGAATGITLEFAFGTNWSEYSIMVGDIFGAPLAAEGIFAFFLESIFLGILVFGRKKVSARVYWLSAMLVFIGAHLSGLWIIIANSFMQTPAGFKLVEGKAVLTNFFEAALNHSTLIRFFHTIIGGWITGSLLVAGIGAWYIIKAKHLEYAKKILAVAMIPFIFSAIIQLGLGHGHSVQVAKTQPEKMAAFEGLWETQKGAPLALFGIPDAEEEKTHLFIGLPKMLSLLIYMDHNAEVKGLKDVPKEERPPVFTSFVSYHIMIGIGTLFLLVAAIGVFLMIKKKMLTSPWFLKGLLFMIPLPYLANEFGWIAAEIGRQPWAVYKILKTADAASPIVGGGEVFFSLIMLGLIYTLLLIIFLKLLLKIIGRGPQVGQEKMPQGG